MPGCNGTGPNGQGPMTGRGMGYCHATDNVNAGQPVDAGFGRGMGRGRGCGMGRARGFGAGRGLRFRNQAPLSAQMTDNERIAELESQVSQLQQEITTLRNTQ